MHNGFTIEADPRVSPKVIKEVKNICKRLEKITPIRHKVFVYIMWQMALNVDNDKVARCKKGKRMVFGRFFSPEDRAILFEDNAWPKDADCMIALPGRLEFLYRTLHFDQPRLRSQAALLGIVLHEAVHYFQFRDKRAFSHDGIDERVARLMKRVLGIKDRR